MGFLDRFRGKPEDRGMPKDRGMLEDGGLDPLRDLVLEKLRVGYLVDYDLKTWRVTDHNRYHYNDGRSSEEWELTEGRTKRYLEHAEGEEGGWSLSRLVPIGALGDVRQRILEHDDPPEEVTHDGTTYYLEGSVGGYMVPGKGGGRQELILWELVDESEDHFLAIMQWSETELTAACGAFVADYEFTNILPGEVA